MGEHRYYPTAGRIPTMNTMYEIMEEIQRQIDWRGPTGAAMGHIVVERDAMIRLMESIRHMEAVLTKNE